MKRARALSPSRPPLKKRARRSADGKVVHFTPERMLDHAAKRFLPEASSRCTKCGSTFVLHEPAFVHCYYCGKMARIANASLLAQELFELRSGLRVAS